MDCFLFPSTAEGLPIALLEAQAAGLPCVISDVITDEVVLSDGVRKMSLERSAAEWAAALPEGPRTDESRANLPAESPGGTGAGRAVCHRPRGRPEPHQEPVLPHGCF